MEKQDEVPAIVHSASTQRSNDLLDLDVSAVPEKKTRKPRRSSREIQAEFEKFKELLEEGRPILEVTRMLGLRKPQSDSYLMKITQEKHRQALSYGVCEGHCLPESIRKILGGDRKDLFKFHPFEDEDGKAVLLKLHMPCK